MAARQRLNPLQSLTLLDITPEDAELTAGILASGKVPRKAAADAAHIAIAAVHGLAEAVIIKAPASICRQHGCECPVICTPGEVLGE